MTTTPPPVEERPADFCLRCRQGPETHRAIGRTLLLCDDGFPSDSPVPHIFDGNDDDGDDPKPRNGYFFGSPDTSNRLDIDLWSPEDVYR